MTSFDVFNGDADGICALQQLRLTSPRENTLVTGVKRDINLLKRVTAAAGDRVTVLDISLDKNRQDLQRLLDQGVKVDYFDHHFSGDIPDHPGLAAHIDPTPDRGTCFLVDAALDGGFRGWAVVGTYGDNFEDTAISLANAMGLKESDLKQLRELGILINYNGYGATVKDLHIPPSDLFRRLQPYPDPLIFIEQDNTVQLLRQGYQEDMQHANSLTPELESDSHGLYIMPCKPWARRVSGVFANQLAQGNRGRAHAILTRLESGGFLVSIRAPLNLPEGADELCRQFPTGGGRKAAAGINRLPESELDRFLTAFARAFSR